MWYCSKQIHENYDVCTMYLMGIQQCEYVIMPKGFFQVNNNIFRY